MSPAPRLDTDYPPHDPVDWIVSYREREVRVTVQSWFGARTIGAARLGVDEALVTVRRADDHETDEERVDASVGRVA
jgi:hypothetical protein